MSIVDTNLINTLKRRGNGIRGGGKQTSAGRTLKNVAESPVEDHAPYYTIAEIVRFTGLSEYLVRKCIKEAGPDSHSRKGAYRGVVILSLEQIKAIPKLAEQLKETL